jgi:Tfp pilus assembly protein PilX
MNPIKRLQQGEQGFALMLVGCLLFITAGLVATILSYASNQRRIAQQQFNLEQAMYVAESGLEYGARFMESNVLAVVMSYSGATNGSGTITVGNTTGSYNFYVEKVAAGTYTIISTGKVNGAYLTTGAHQTNWVCRTVRLLNVWQPSYAQFALWTRKSNGLAFKVGEVFNGHVHADDVMTFNNAGGGPIFHSVVSTLTNTYAGNTNGIVFDQGFLFNSYQGTMADVDFNSIRSTSLKNEAISQGLLLWGTNTITFNSNGTLTISGRSGSSIWTNRGYQFNSTNGLIYVMTSNSNAGVILLNGGTMTGRLTLVSDTNMYIQGNVTYKTNPQVTNSTDALALIARDNIIVNTNAPNNVLIQAALLVPGSNTISGGVTNFLDGSFSVLNYNTRAASSNLNIYGCIVQSSRGAVGTFNGSTGQLLTGFNKNYQYDPRFINTPPPFFPTVSSQLIFSQWQGR